MDSNQKSGLRQLWQKYNDMRLWKLRIHLLTRDLLSLGCPYSVEFSGFESNGNVETTDLGVEFINVVGSKLLQIKRTCTPAPHVQSRVISSQRSCADITSMAWMDYLVAINTYDVILEPLTTSETRKLIAQFATATNSTSKDVLTLHFVRLHRLVQVNSATNLTHANVLERLMKMSNMANQLSSHHKELVIQMGVSELKRSKKQLDFIVGEIHALQQMVVQNPSYALMARFQRWYANQVANLRVYNAKIEAEGEMIIIDDEQEEMPIIVDGEVEVMSRKLTLPSVLDLSRSKSANHDKVSSTSRIPTTTTMPRKDVYARLNELNAGQVDLSWHTDTFPFQQLKWLPNARGVLTTFIEGLTDSFLCDGVWSPVIATTSRAIAEQLVRVYCERLYKGQIKDNATVKKEFAQHARMLRTNLGVMGNGFLRQSLLQGDRSVTELCGMTSEQLAPQALQEERLRRAEQYEKEITITQTQGPKYVKTKHGMKEVYPDGLPRSQEIEETKPVVHMEAPDFKMNITQTSIETATEEVTQRFQQSLDIDQKPKRSVRFAREIEINTILPVPPRNTHSPRTKHRPRSYPPLLSVRDGQAFLHALMDSSQGLMEWFHQFQQTVTEMTSMATMSREFLVMRDVKFYPSWRCTVQDSGRALLHHARVQIAHLNVECSNTSDQAATLDAVHQLIRNLVELKRMVGNLLLQLCDEFHLNSMNDVEDWRRRDHAFGFLIQNRIVTVKDWEQENRKVDAVAFFDSTLPLAKASATNSAQARSGAAYELIRFLVLLREGATSDIDQVTRDHERYPAQNPIASSVRNESERHDHPPRYTTTNNQCPRKRPAESTRIELPTVRQRTHSPPRELPITEETPSFFVDAVGQVEPPTPVVSREKRLKIQVESYQQLLQWLFRNSFDAEAQLRQLNWDPRLNKQKVEGFSKCMIEYAVTRDSNTNQYMCELSAGEGLIECRVKENELQRAIDGVVKLVLNEISQIVNDWKILTSEYNNILDRKSRERTKQADPTLSAANETRMSKVVNRWVADSEQRVGHLSEYVLSIRGHPVIRHACLNAKMAKRAACEEFRDLLRSLVPRKQPPQPLSHDSDSSDDGMDYYSNDEDDGWTPSVKADVPSTSVKRGSSTRQLIETELVRRYDIDSEQMMTDDAQFRALVRALFVQTDDLHIELQQLRGVVLARGQCQRQRVATNVYITIQMKRLESDRYVAEAFVNNVVTLQAQTSSRKAVVEMIIEKISSRFAEIHTHWKQLLNFLHTKMMGTSDPLGSFNALRLANIRKFTTSIESTHGKDAGVTCTFSIDDYVVLHSNGETEEVAKLMADCRVLKFLEDLIDHQLDTHQEEPKPSVVDTDSIFGHRTPRAVDWTASLSLHTFGFSDQLMQYECDACWCIDDRIPVDFPYDSTGASIQLVQTSIVKMSEVERMFARLHESLLLYFRLDPIYDQGKFINHVAQYGHKSPMRSCVIECQIPKVSQYVAYIVPPGASINSENNLYWPEQHMPRQCSDRKAVYGFLFPANKVSEYFGPNRLEQRREEQMQRRW